MPFEYDDRSINFSLRSQGNFVPMSETDLLRELKRPIPSPDFAPSVLSRMGRAMPGLTGHAGFRQAIVWRSSVAAALAAAATIGLWYGSLPRPSQMTMKGDPLPKIVEVVESIEENVEPGRMALSSLAIAADHVAGHLQPNTGAAPLFASEDRQGKKTERRRRSIFPVAERFWSMSPRNPSLGPGPAAAEKNLNPNSSHSDDQKAESASAKEEWEKAHPKRKPDLRFLAMNGGDQ